MGKYNTDSVTWRKLGPHGRVEISESIENIIFYKAYGPFNTELIKVLRELEQPFLKKRIQGKKQWVTLVEFRESCMITTEAKDILYQYLEQCRENGVIQLATAMVVSDEIEGKILAESLYSQCYQNVDVPFKIFKDNDSAVSWLTEQYTIGKC